MNFIAKRCALPLLALGSLLGANAMAAGPTIIGSVYLPNVDFDAQSASPDSLLLEIRQPLNDYFWIGGTLGSALSSDQLSPGNDAKLGTSFDVNLGVQTEFSHHFFGYAYLGYGKAKLSTTGGDIDGNGMAWGLGVDFQLQNHLVVDAGYASLFDDRMKDSGGVEHDIAIAGPRVGLGFKF